MRLISILAATAAIVLGCISCDKGNTDDKTTDNGRQDIDLTTKSAAFVKGGNEFAFDFLARTDAATADDFIISPLSMQFLLGMLLDGAQGKTAAEICKVLGYGSGDVDAVNEFCLLMLKNLPLMDKMTKIAIANAIFVDDGWPLKEKYVETVGKYFEAGVSNLDFAKTKESAAMINSWCSDHTGGLVPKILDETSPEILAYLLNATYFKSEWKEKFSKELTAKEAFYSSGGKKMDPVQMMKKTGTLPFIENSAFRAVRIPYGNGTYTMTVLLPASGKTPADVCKALKGTDWNQFFDSMGSAMVDLWLPKFETSFKIKLNDMLSEMGMPSAFDELKAEFKAMSDYALCLSFVQQDAAIKVDEEGSEAAAVSSAGMIKETSVRPMEQTVVFHADHPFIYVITESGTGAILFAGRYSGK